MAGQEVVLGWVGDVPIPIGCKFNPTDTEVILHYLLPKARNPFQLRFDFIPELQVYQHPPWILHRDADLRYSVEDEFYCFFSVKMSSAKDGRLPRKAVGGHWWPSSGTEYVKDQNGIVIGSWKKLKFLMDGGVDAGGPAVEKKRKKDKSLGTVWVMQEFRLSSDMPNVYDNGYETVLCRISPSGNGAYDDRPRQEPSSSRCSRRRRDDTVNEALSGLLRDPHREGKTPPQLATSAAAPPPPPQAEGISNVIYHPVVPLQAPYPTDFQPSMLTAPPLQAERIMTCPLRPRQMVYPVDTQVLDVMSYEQDALQGWPSSCPSEHWSQTGPYSDRVLERDVAPSYDQFVQPLAGEQLTAAAAAAGEAAGGVGDAQPSIVEGAAGGSGGAHELEDDEELAALLWNPEMPNFLTF